MGLFGPNKAERDAQTKAYIGGIVKVKPMGVTVSEEGSNGYFTNYIIYAFLLQFSDGHRELYSGKADDQVIQAILGMIEM